MWIGLAIAAATLVGIIYAASVKIRKAWHRGRQETVAVRDAILGREAVCDSITGKELAPALPGIGQRMANTEAQMAVITEAVAKLADTHQRLDKHEQRIEKLEAASVERIVTRAESAQAFRAMEAAINASPDEDADQP